MIRKGAVFAALLIALSGCDNKPAAPVEVKPALTLEQRAAVVESATRGMQLERDKMESISFFSAKGEPWIGNGITVYVAVPDNTHAFLRVSPHYQGSEWIFFKRIKVMADSRIVYEKDFSALRMKHDNNSSGVYESVDYAAEVIDVDAMREIAAAKSVTVRLSGDDKREEFDLTEKDRARIARSLSAFDALSAI
jgi:hypothetical protein